MGKGGIAMNNESTITNEKDVTVLLLVPEGQFLAGEDRFPVTLPAYHLGIARKLNCQVHAICDLIHT
jgi:hypothetical protein